MRSSVVIAVAAFALASCSKGDRPKSKPAPSLQRFAAVQPEKAEASARFCEKTFPATGVSARPYTAPPLRATVAEGPTMPSAKAWTWLNVWATWCEPCMDEMALLGRWRDGLAKDGVEVKLTLLSADATDAESTLREVAKRLPGAVPWLRAPEDLPAFLATLGVDTAAALPVHALVDPDNKVRCVRVGAIHDRDYGAVKALLSGT